MKLLEQYLQEALSWDPEEFVKIWNATYSEGGTRHDVADKLGLTPPIVSNRAVYAASLGFKIADFKSKDAPWRQKRRAGIAQQRLDPHAQPSKSHYRKEIDVDEVIELIKKNRGDYTAASKEFGMTPAQFYGLLQKIKIQFPGIEIPTRGRGRPKLEGITDEKFRQIWNSAADVKDAAEKISAAFPSVRPDRVANIAWQIRKRLGQDYLVKLPDARTLRWKFKRAGEEQKIANTEIPVVDDSSVDLDLDQFEFLDDVGSFTNDDDDVKTSEQPIDDIDVVSPDAEFVDLDSTSDESAIDDLGDLSSLDQVDDEKVDEPASSKGLTESEREFVDIWNSSFDSATAFRELKKAGWSKLSAINMKKDLVKKGVEFKKFSE